MGYTTWNPADKHADISLSGDNLIAENTNWGVHAVRSITGVSSSKWYWEVTINVDNSAQRYNSVGIGTTDAGLGIDPGQDVNGYGYWGRDGKKYHNAVGLAFGSSYSQVTIGIALDMDTGKLWWSLNGSWQASGNPGAGTNEAYSGISGTFYPMLSMYGLNSRATANFGASAFSYAVPGGFHSGIIDPISADADITIPLITVQGYTGIYSAPSIPMIQAEGFTGIDARDVTNPSMQVEGFTGIYSALSIPMQTVIMTGSDNMTHIESSLTIPSMSVAITQAKQIWGNVSVPMMTAKITERETVLSNITVPMMTVELSSGVHADLEATTPMMTVEATLGARGEATVPMMGMDAEVTVGRVVHGEATIPMMEVELYGITEQLANADATIPMMKASAYLYSGKIIRGDANIPMMMAEITAYQNINGDINATIPMMTAEISGSPDRAACEVLRYEDP